MQINDRFRRAFRFFHTHAGYATPPGRAQCALNMARAEKWFLDRDDLEFVTEDDDERAYCYCDNKDCKYHEDSDEDWPTIHARIVQPCPDHGIDCRHAETLASLGGIMDPDTDYLRVIRAELAAEVMHERSR